MVLYNLVIYIYLAAIKIASIFNPKAKLWVKGRRDWKSQLSGKFDNERVVWFHCASLGEFEQGRPVIEAFRRRYPHYKILLTFFSPSGYEVRKNYKEADWVCYLPMDTPSNARRFVEIVKPEMVFFVKYEFWFNYIETILSKRIPLYFISVIFRPNQYFFTFLGKGYLNRLKSVTRFFLQDTDSYDLLRTNGFVRMTVSGDTRFDRVAQVASEKWSHPILDAFCKNRLTIVCGSTWKEDEQLIKKLAESCNNNVCFVIAPHLVDKAHLDEMQQLFNNIGVVLLSECSEQVATQNKVLIIDSIGMLSYIYRYGKIAYVGGGFGKSIHNILEAVVYGIPVIFGPKYHKFREANELIALQGAFSIKNYNELKEVAENLFRNDYYKEVSEICIEYVRRRTGAVNKILEELSKHNWKGC